MHRHEKPSSATPSTHARLGLMSLCLAGSRPPFPHAWSQTSQPNPEPQDVLKRLGCVIGPFCPVLIPESAGASNFPRRAFRREIE